MSELKLTGHHERPRLLHGSTVQARPALATDGMARPVWLVGVLTFGTLGVYAFYWLWATWCTVKSARNEPCRGHGLWHVLGLLVPVYGLWRLYAHMEAVYSLARWAGAPTFLKPGVCVLVWMMVPMLRLLPGVPWRGWSRCLDMGPPGGTGQPSNH